MSSECKSGAIIKKNIFTALFFIISISAIPLSGQNPDDIEGTIEDNLNPPALQELIDYNRSNNTKNGFSAHKQNYILPYTYSLLDDDDGRKKYEIKFQMSLKQRLLKFYGWAFYFGYTQKSFWQAYDFSESRPFRENNFNPEFFLRTKIWSGLRIDTGGEHESNGKDLPYSRSWNRIYISPYFENDYIILRLKGWYRIKEDKKKNESDTDGDDNPDIHKYYGYGELGLTVKFPELNQTYLSSFARYNPKYNRGAIEVNLTVPLPLSSMSFMVQYWNGYGESLIDYDVKQQKFGIGLNFTR